MRNLLLIIILLCGCSSTKEPNITVSTTRQWEGRYSDIHIARNALEDAELADKESVWILRSSTLTTILQNVRKNNEKQQ